MTAHVIILAMNPAIDKSATIDRVVPERKLRCSKPQYDPGGGGINVAQAVSKLGGQSTVYYTSGRAQGRLLQGILNAEGLDHRPMPINDRTRESFTINESSTGLQYRFSTPGPELDRTEWEHCLYRMTHPDKKPDYLVASGSIPPGVPTDFYARLARYAKKIDARMILDATGDPFAKAVAEGVFLIKPNLRELKTFTGKDLAEESQQVEAAENLVARGHSEIVVVSLGAAGALMVWKNGCERLRAPTVSIGSKVGAGDSMVGGITKAIAAGASPVNAVQYGVAAGAAAVMTPGTMLCRLEDTQKLFSRISEERNRHPCRTTE
jgi:6-phosphofructokinase 2